MSSQKVALVADWITHWGGAERVLQKLMEMYPDAEIYTSVFFPERPEIFKGRKIHTSFIQYLPFLNRRHKLCMLLRPLAFSMFRFDQYDLVITSCSAEAKGIRTRKKFQIEPPSGRGVSPALVGDGGILYQKILSHAKGATAPSKRSLHICYCHTPTRYLWSHTEQYKKNLEFGGLNWLAKCIIPIAFKIMRRWDSKAAQRPDIFIANSITTQERIREYYKRESEVVYPFLSKVQSTKYKVQSNGENLKFENGNCINSPLVCCEQTEGAGGVENYFVCLGRIVPYKRFDLAILACNQLGKNLKIFTSTKNLEAERLQKISGPTIEWIFGASDREVADALEHAKGFIMPQEEDFGIVALEAMAHGTPVIAYGEGGAMETVIHGETGLLFSEQTVESLVLALERAQDIEWNREKIRAQGTSFSEERFEEGLLKIIDNTIMDNR